jgi:hypothetical protein
MAKAKPLADEETDDTQDNPMVDTTKQRRNYRFTRRMLYKMKKLLETNYWQNETELLESSVDLIYEMLLKGELPEGFEITVKDVTEEKEKK